MIMDFNHIPLELKDRPQWVLWKLEERDGKPTKIPYQPRDPKQKASSTNPDTWGTLERVLSVLKTNGFAGIGYVFSPEDDYAGVDLDHCRKFKMAEIDPWARKIITGFYSYTENSQSETGVHIILKGKVPPGGNKKGNVEMYSESRFFVMTGQHLKGTPTTIESRQSELEALHLKTFGKPQAPPQARGPLSVLELSDRELIEKAKTARNGDKFSRLWGGDITGYDTPSEATAALLKLLVFWCGPDPGRVERLFRQSGLMREKWDRPQSGSTWGRLEIDKAIARTPEYYTPSQGPPGANSTGAKRGKKKKAGGQAQGNLQGHKEGESGRIAWIGHKYFVEGGRLCLETHDRKTAMPLTCSLANFQARIEEEITRDDGQRTLKEFLVTGNLDTGRPLPPARIPAREFDGLSWIRREWGAAASQAPGRSLGLHLVNAIQAHSQGFKRRTVFVHTGWRKISGVWRYLHGGGAIGPGEAVELDLGENLGNYRLPDPGGIESAQASLRFLEIGPWEITAPLIACVYLAPFADLLKIDFSLWIYGPTGSLKSTLAALALSHFGNFSRTTLPGSWFSTVNSLEKLCFTLKDSLVVIDDFMPAANPKESQKMGESAARLIYQAGNRSGRGRLAADLSARPNHYPRGLIISTGEMLLPGQRQSATARYLGLELDPKKTPIDKARLTAAQREAHLYPASMAAYLADLAPRLEDAQAETKDLWEYYRTAFQSTAHLRIPEIQAWLAVGFEIFLRFQVRMGAIPVGQKCGIEKQAAQVWKTLGEAHARRIEGERPTLKFLAILRELFYQGRVYVESTTMAGAPPPAREVLGWNRTEPANNAELIGWADDDTLFLMTEMSVKVVHESIIRQGDFLSLGKNDLLAALAREGIIEPGKGENTKFKWIQGTSKRVICLPLKNLFHCEATEDGDE